MQGHVANTDPVPNSPVALFDQSGRLLGWSPAFAEHCTRTAGELVDCSVADLWPELDEARWRQIWARMQAAGSLDALQVYARPPSTGEAPRFVELEIGMFVGASGPAAKIEVRRASASERVRLLQQEILECMANGAELKTLMNLLCRRAEALAPAAICSVLSVNRRQQVRHVASPSLPEPYARAIDGQLIGPQAGSCGTAAFRGEPVEVTDIANDPLWAEYKDLALPLGLRACWSSPIKGSDGRVLGLFALYYPRQRGPTALERKIVETCLHLSAIAFEHAETRARAYELAFTDPLTHLPNRARFQRRLSEALAVAAESDQRVAVQYVGLDRFRAVNDLFGYATGDEVLRIMAARLQGLVKDHGCVARLGGDEFAVLQIGALTDTGVAARAKQILEAVREPCIIAGQRVELTASVGVSICAGDHGNAENIIDDAGLAARRAKELGGGAYFFHERDLNARMQARRRVEADLRTALANRQFELHFQPIYDLRSRRVRAAEALVRWRHPERGLVWPKDFISLAEECGLIDEIGAWVVREACSTARRWPDDLVVAVNLSPTQFKKPGLARVVAEALADSGLEPRRLELEITESVLLSDSAANIAVLDQLSDLGVSIALDDFGTGYSSLSYLQRFSFDRIKIDHSFIRDITRNDDSLKIVRAIVMLAHSLGLLVTAEGVETEPQLAAVLQEGCDDVQGHYIGIPVPATDFFEGIVKATDDRIVRDPMSKNARTFAP